MKHTILCKKSVYTEDRQGWFIDEEYNQIYCIDIETKEVHYTANFAENKCCNGNLLKKCGNKLYIFPVYSKGNISICNLTDGNIEKIKLPTVCDNSYEILGVWETKEVLLAYSAGLHQIIEISKAEHRIVRYYDLRHNEIKVNGLLQDKHSENIVFRHGELIIVDFLRGSIKSYNVADIDNEVWGFTYDNGFLWINKRQRLYLYNMMICKTETYVELPDNLIKDNAGSVAFAGYASENYIWFIFLYSNKFMYLDKKNKEIKFITLDKELVNGKKRVRYLLNFVSGNRYLYLYSIYRNANFVVDMETASYWDVEFEIEDKEYQRSTIEWMGLQKDGYIRENAHKDFNRFMQGCTLGIQKENAQTNIGIKIYHMIKSGDK